jgi:cephalosporin-C deacetylase-like acetyl esterase
MRRGFRRIAIAGDSAGGGLTLAVLRFVTEHFEVKCVFWRP